MQFFEICHLPLQSPFFRLIFSSFKLLNSLVFLGLLYMVKTHLGNSGLCSIIKLFSALGITRKQSPSHQILSKVLIFLTKVIGNLPLTTTYQLFRRNPPLISSLALMFLLSTISIYIEFTCYSTFSIANCPFPLSVLVIISETTT